ncbi:hypothetical protein AYO21_11971 [Fonsecaea monophora]|uniref:AB hydrolase-1 domain-containing protein n=1 Tax=Fonsecaea monophora TaxID=254056 RepID=A0A177EPK2_9EURO|nr:hypothetical protein AYO21_11971 [Fonsecaea monophora]OAG33913.1 hypothetical protein AYO21_11971 [Fonsecaea monophora]
MSPSIESPNGDNGAVNGTHIENDKISATPTNKSSVETAPPASVSAKELIGYHEASRFAGEYLAGKVRRTVEQCPGLGRHILDVGFGTAMAQTSLSYREWALVSIATLTALGDVDDQLKVYVTGALTHGATIEEIQDIFQHANSFAGAPRSVNAVRHTHDLLSQWQSGSEPRQLPLPKGYTESIVLLGDHETMVRDTGGSGIPIVLIHALSMDGRMWRQVLPLLAAPDTRVIAYDLRGHGYARGAPLTRDLEHLCADLALLLNRLGVERADIYGASYGGAVAQYFALDYPQRTRSLAAIATAGKAPAVLATRATRAEEHGMDSLVAESVIRWFLPETIAQDTWCVRYARGCVRRARVEDWAAAWRAMAQLDCLERLPTLKTMPVLSLAGKQDLSATPPMMKAIADACTGNPNVEYHEIDPGTHMMVMEMPKPVAEKLAAFRKKVDGLVDK